MLVILTEHIPVQDVLYIMAAAREADAKILGPEYRWPGDPGRVLRRVSCLPSIATSSLPDEWVSFLAAVASARLICLNLVQAGFGESAFIGIGGDPVIGTTTRDALESLDGDPKDAKQW